MSPRIEPGPAWPRPWHDLPARARRVDPRGKLRRRILAGILATTLAGIPGKISALPTPGSGEGGGRAGSAPLVLVAEAPPLAGRVEVLYWEGGEARALRVLRVLEAHARLPGLPPEVPARARIILAPDSARWDAWTGGAVPHWGAGVAIPALDRIVLPLFRNPWTGGISEDRVLRHEWAHLGLHAYLSGLRVPRWFDEGYAQWSSGGWDRTAAWKLRVALARGTAPPLSELSLEWPRGRGEAELAYLLSASAMDFLVELHGSRGLEVLLTRWREEESFEGAFRRTFGMTTGQFEERWTEQVRRRYGWVLLLSQTAVVWGGFALLLLLLFGLRRHRDRDRWAALDRGLDEESSGMRPSGEAGWWWRPFGITRSRPDLPGADRRHHGPGRPPGEERHGGVSEHDPVDPPGTTR